VALGVAPEALNSYGRKPTVQEGTYAEYITLKAKTVSPMPETLDFAQAATLPLTGLTAWQALFDAAKVTEKDTVLITGGSGGVGSLAVQFAKSRGAQVITIAGSRSQDYVRKLGADTIFDYEKQNIPQEIEGIASTVTAIFDTVGGQSLIDAMNLAPQGTRVVSIVDTPNEAIAKERALETHFVFVEPNGSQLNEIASLIDSGKVTPARGTEMSIKNAGFAQDQNETGKVRGKIALKIDF